MQKKIDFRHETQMNRACNRDSSLHDCSYMRIDNICAKKKMWFMALLLNFFATCIPQIPESRTLLETPFFQMPPVKFIPEYAELKSSYQT